MHKLISAACRRTAGIAAGVILTGGVAGAVLLTPGTAFASTATPPSTLNTTTAITSTSQTPASVGTLTVFVSVSAGAGNTEPTTGNVDVTGAGNGCTVTLNGSNAGSCSISNLQPGGTYTLTAAYEGSTGYNQSPASSPVTVTIYQAPAFDVANPPQTATPGQNYGYTFHASGYPAPTYSLAGAPKWLNINSSTGTVWATVPYWASSFSYSVVASNGVGSPATAGPFWVKVRHGYVNINTYLSCTSKVFTGQKGSCTLWVTNRGYSPASNVTAQIALPRPLRADYCGYFWGWSFGCTISNNTAYENLGTLNPGQTKALTVVFTAKSGWSLWGRHPGHRFTVKVVGSASSNGYWWFFGQRRSYSVAYVTIIPRGFWW
jgi:hypothetical protein